MSKNAKLFVGGGGTDYADAQTLPLKYANRHGLIAGATGTGKTVTLQILAEGFSDAGVPVFMSDVKGDLSGLAQAGSHTHKLHDKLIERALKIGFDDYDYRAYPTVFWDMFGQQGHPVRTTVIEMGPLLLSRLLELNETQEGVLNIVFRVAAEDGLALLDMADLRAMLVHVGERAKELSLKYGNVSTASIGAIQRRLLVLENQGGDQFFGEPALELSDMIATTPDGRGRINILAADKLMQSPRLYATFLLWLLSELFEQLPEVGDPDKPLFVFFFDEAHLLFEGAPKALLDKVEQVARLIRSKGVGVYFITQNPADVPDDILGQLGNRVQHALRAYTPRDRKALKAAAETFRPNPAFKTDRAILEVGVGEALVSTLEKKGVPSVVERTLIRPPASRLGPCDAMVRAQAIAQSPVAGLYDTLADRESAYEILAARAARKAEADAEVDAEELSAARTFGGKYSKGKRYNPAKPSKRVRKAQSRRRGDTIFEAAAKSAMRSAGSQLGRTVVKSLLKGLFR
ncbi:MAG: helicase HerA-like domain-containing protein [Pseudomonadota bacterium]